MEGRWILLHPGVDVYSSWILPENYIYFQEPHGHSMCCGIAALFWEAYPKAFSLRYMDVSYTICIETQLNASDVGAGLVQPPRYYHSDFSYFGRRR